MEQETIIIVSVFSAAWAVLLVLVLLQCCTMRRLRRRLDDLESAPGRVRVQSVAKITNEDHKNHAYHNPAISPGEELSKRGYSMYVGHEDAESGRGTERQTGGQYVSELQRELDKRQQRQSQAAAPPFLLHSIEHSKRHTRDLANPVANPPANGNRVNQAGNHAVNQTGHHVGNQSGNHAGHQAGNHLSNNQNHQTRQSDTNPNFIY